VTSAATAIDEALSLYLERHDVALRQLTVYARERFAGRWQVSVMRREELLERLDSVGRDLCCATAEHRQVAKKMAAWIRGTAGCVEIVHDRNGTLTPGTVVRA
jgi:hypothetical protein